MFKTTIKKAIYYLAFLHQSNHKSKVIYYHDVSKKYTDMGTEEALMRAHFDMIRHEGYKFVSNINRPEREVMVCFDDGWRGIYEHKALFFEYGIKPTIFIAVSLIGQEGYLSVNEIKELKTLGFNFECHAWSHYDLTTYNDIELEHELKDSKYHLEQVFNQPFNSICYPQGRFSKHVHDMCAEFGYTKQFSSISGDYFEMKDRGIICRNCAQSSSPKEFKWLLNSKSRFFQKRFIKLQFEGNFNQF